jgi:hypothetical protein
MPLYVELELASLDILKARVEIDFITGVIGSELVVENRDLFKRGLETDDDDEIEYGELVEMVKKLVSDTVQSLAVLGVVGDIRFGYEVSGHPDDEDVEKAMDEVLQSIPNPARITLELVAEARKAAREGMEKEAQLYKSLSRAMQEEGLKRGLNKEERDNMTIGEFANLDKDDAEDKA